jgi:NTP pyrophosphatase (non-canonical NTP hydrolase)
MKSFEEVTHAEMVTILAKSGSAILEEMTPKKCALIHHAACIMEEVGELAEGLERLDENNVIEELGDIEFYFEGLCQELDITMEDSIRCSTTDITLVVIAAANLYGAIKPHLFYNKTLDLDKVKGNAIVFRHTLDSIYKSYGILKGEATEANKSKLSKRYHKLEFSNSQAQGRADKQKT